jgi:hypothetical protein
VSSKPRQAVVIIHGIGEQRPMETLRKFVTAVTEIVPGPLEHKAESKPDHLSPTLELRRMAVPGENVSWSAGQWVSTDFYELYWAHLMTGTAWRHVTAWISTLMLRRPGQVPRRLKTAWWACWILAAVALIVLVGFGPDTIVWWSRLGAVGAIALLLCRATGTHFGLQYAGDAARYLNARPENVGVRHDIRAQAVDLLEKLHDDPSWRRYHRIVVVGHSLGSVIAYDALSHLWQRRHHPKRTFDVSSAVFDAQASGNYREQQAATWRAQRAMGVQWKITDLITLGSPLAHAPFLMASNDDDFRNRKEQREYPTCPPQPNDQRDTQYGVDLLLDTSTGRHLLHHAALFACTRWTNFYFDSDIIGGPIACLGGGIDNNRLDRPGGFSHTQYWRPRIRHEALMAALDLKNWWTEPENVRVAIDAQQRDTDALTPGDMVA